MLRSCMAPPSPSWRKTDIQATWKWKLVEQMNKSGALVQDRKGEKIEMEIEEGLKKKHSKI